MVKYYIHSGEEKEDLELSPGDSWMAVEIPDAFAERYHQAKAEWESVQEVLTEYGKEANRIRQERLCPDKVAHCYEGDPRFPHWKFDPQPCYRYVDDNGVCPDKDKHVKDDDK